MRYALGILAFCFLGTTMAQDASVGFDPLGPVDRYIHDQVDSLHGSLRPFNPGFESKFYEHTGEGLDSTDKGKIEIGLTGNIRGGAQVANETRGILLSSAGIEIKASHKDKLFGSFSYTPVLSAPASTYSRLADSLRIIPGAGFAQNQGGLWISHVLQGRAIWNASDIFSFEVGQGKHFWGDGYRTLILSHNAAPFPYARISTKIWKIKYVNLWAQQRDITNSVDYQSARRKYTSLHALSWQATRRLNFTLYEMVIWQATDTLVNRGLDFNYLNPIIFFRPVEFSQGSADNVMLGLSWKWKINANNQFYGQWMFDEFLLLELRRGEGWWANKWGIQLGVKNFDVITPGLHVLNEFNVVRPFTYTHGSVVQAYGHVNQGLAHPFGTNFAEWVNIWRYERDDWFVSQKFIWGIWGRDIGDDNFGGNIFRSYKNPSFQYGNTVAQGLKSTFHWEEITYGRKLNDALNLWLDASVAFRFDRNDHHEYIDLMFNVGVRTTPFASYRDF